MRPRHLVPSLVAAGALGDAHLLAAVALRGRARALAAGLGAADWGPNPAPGAPGHRARVHRARRARG